MHKELLILCFIFSVSSLNVGLTLAGDDSGVSPAGESPFTPKAYVIRYWNKQIKNGLPISSFLISKASPLNAVQSAAFSKQSSDQSWLSNNLMAFCSSAKLFCFPDMTVSLANHDKDANFIKYDFNEQNFTNYGTGKLGGVDQFANYSDNENIPFNSFRQYSRNSVKHNDKFNFYAPDGNVIDQNFKGYGKGATAGTGRFDNYNKDVNIPGLNFASYSDDSNGRVQKFTSYATDTNAGSEQFRSYGKNGNGTPNEFVSYGNNSNVVASDFNGYGETSNSANNSFTSYADNGNVPLNTFKNYDKGGNAGVDSFNSYRDRTNVGDDKFQSYGKKSNAEKVTFANYGQTLNEGSDIFSGYGKGANDQTTDFKIYGVNTTFTDYAKQGVTFAEYNQTKNKFVPSMAAAGARVGKSVNKWVEPGKFFRESMLKEGTLIPMPDIRDKMPKRAFLPRSIVSKLPFSTSKLEQMRMNFHAAENSSMSSILSKGVSECERAPSAGETKRCIASAEDMIDFATLILGRNIRLRTTDNIAGSTHDVLIGTVIGINGGHVTKSVSCHQSLFPYLLYYCHSVPTVRVYEADLHDPVTKSKINHGVAICHLDTSSWSATHGAFLSLGSGPGKIEVCHWIFENDLTWTIAD